MTRYADAVLFDLDGTLLDTAADMAAAANHVLALHQFPPLSKRQIQDNTSYGATGLLKAGFGEHIATMDAKSLRGQFLDYYANHICHGTTQYAGVSEMLAGLDELDIPWGIVTNKPTYLTELLLPHFDLLTRTRVLVCADTLTVAKPHPEPLWYAADQLHIGANRCLYIGDIRNDVIAAKNATMLSAVAAWGYTGADGNPIGWEADQILSNPVDLLSLF
ncbi:HAD-IA family hydrolase [Parasalinivibrio latis]|uniref:HAD family hydrolase n=1 Tax=Parasalinivibrio latis TaxID=2952610 RepID=UPI0030E48949